jgi:DNA helicase-4
MQIFQESIKSFVRTYLDFSYSLFFIKSKIALKKHKKLFDSGVVKNPLTYRQRVSVILDEKRNMVVAGAGTGKTTTILAKVLYLIKDKNTNIIKNKQKFIQ